MNEGQNSQINPRKYQHGRDSKVHSVYLLQALLLSVTGGTWKTICGDEQPNKNGLKRTHVQGFLPAASTISHSQPNVSQKWCWSLALRNQWPKTFRRLRTHSFLWHLLTSCKFPDNMQWEIFFFLSMNVFNIPFLKSMYFKKPQWSIPTW